ncbi:MAG: hypothetical protein ACRCXC_00220 [Legionella sp.]
MQAIENKELLEKKRQEIEASFHNKQIPLSPDYCGFRMQPKRMVFYTYRLDELSDVWEYVLKKMGGLSNDYRHKWSDFSGDLRTRSLGAA